ncbi:endo alpha-1,4 polygalactosaminidase [Saccharothrix violaceirubra]|uniref:Cysteinyl-tRNA synthetase n=1 Tax=Saccharothrix violaceirubra TaxID=413306 RepID=A0A7W7T1Y8_9PSEU|nr:endo alpha-1,4 polygalactosaminidase [Saccharothrix violaceirubra]MBB4965084.1 cysteinyl-tRNA synthetase [Saccharothrix violaceirubra]
MVVFLLISLSGLAGCSRESPPVVPGGFVYQLQGYQDERLGELAGTSARYAVVDLARDAGESYFSAEEIGALKGSGKIVLAYFEIGSIEDFRPDFASTGAGLTLNEWETWPGEFFVRYWEERWWELGIKPRLDRALQAGFDGVYLDTPLAYEEIDLALVPGLDREVLGRRMVDLIMRISSYAKGARSDFRVYPQNSPELVRYSGFLDAVDGIGIEELFFEATDEPCTADYCATNLAATREVRRAGKTVLAVDYAVRPDNMAEACRRYREEGFEGYVAVRALDRISAQCR